MADAETGAAHHAHVSVERVLRTVVACVCCAVLCGCPEKENREMKVIDGYVIGDRAGAAQPLTVGVGMSTHQLVERNAFLVPLNLNVSQPLRLPLLAKLDVTYDDGNVRLALGCVHSAGVDEHNGFAGVGYAGFELCDQHINDWPGATRQATELIRALLRTNPKMENVRQWAATVPTAEWIAIAGDIRIPREILSEEQANQRFADLSARGDPMQFAQDTNVELGLFRSGRTMFSIGIKKDRAFNGDITEEQKKAMNYRVGVSSILLADGKAK
jgi:hypothetical protein